MNARCASFFQGHVSLLIRFRHFLLCPAETMAICRVTTGSRCGSRSAVPARGPRPGARELSELAREMQADITNKSLLRHIVLAAVSEVPGAEDAYITLITSKEITTPAATADLGILSMLSCQLFVEDESFGALNLYAGDAKAFGARRAVQDHRTAGVRLWSPRPRPWTANRDIAEHLVATGKLLTRSG